MLPLQSLIRPPEQVGDLPPDAGPGANGQAAGPGGPAALTRARLVSAAGGQAVFAGQASDGDDLTVRVTAIADGVIRVSLGRDGTERPRSEAALPLVRDSPCTPVIFMPNGTVRGSACVRAVSSRMSLWTRGPCGSRTRGAWPGRRAGRCLPSSGTTPT